MSTLAQPDVPAGTVIDFLGSTSTSQVRRRVCSQSIVKVPHNSPVGCADTFDEPARQASRHPTLHTPAFQQLDDIASLFVARQQKMVLARTVRVLRETFLNPTYPPAGKVSYADSATATSENETLCRVSWVKDFER